MRHTEDFLAMRTEVDVSPTESAAKLCEPHRLDPTLTMGTDWVYAVFPFQIHVLPP